MINKYIYPIIIELINVNYYFNCLASESHIHILNINYPSHIIREKADEHIPCSHPDKLYI